MPSLELLGRALSSLDGHRPCTVPDPRLRGSNIADPNRLLWEGTLSLVDSALQAKDVVHEIGVAVVSSIGSAWDLKSFCQKLFNSWGIGDKRRNDGVLYVLALHQRQHRIVTGRGVATLLTSDDAKGILERINVLLKRGEVDKAILQVAVELRRAIQNGKRRQKLVIIGLICLIVAMICGCVQSRRQARREELYREHAQRLRRLAEQRRGQEQSDSLEATPCPICLDPLCQEPLQASDFDDAERPVVHGVELTRCGHLLHRGCLSRWLERSQTCPLCRAADPRIILALAAVPAIHALRVDTATRPRLQGILDSIFDDVAAHRRAELWDEFFEGRPRPSTAETHYTHSRSSSGGWGGGSCDGGGGASSSF